MEEVERPEEKVPPKNTAAAAASDANSSTRVIDTVAVARRWTHLRAAIKSLKTTLAAAVPAGRPSRATLQEKIVKALWNPNEKRSAAAAGA